MIVFNINALIQALGIGLIMFLIYILGIETLIEESQLSERLVFMLFFYGIYFFLSYTHKIGIKGTLFWIPTWFLMLLFIFLFNVYGNRVYYDENINTWYHEAFVILNYFLPFYLFYRKIHSINNEFVLNFEKGKSALMGINKSEEWYLNNKKEFWIRVSHAYVKRPFLFRNMYWLYALLYRDSITNKVFMEHYKALVEILKDKATIPSDNTMFEMYHKLILMHIRNNTEMVQNYTEDIAKVIDKENKIYQ